MSFPNFKRKELFFLGLLVGTAILKAFPVCCQDIEMTCDNFVHGEPTVCNCSINFTQTLPGNCTLKKEGNIILEDDTKGRVSGRFRESSDRQCVCCFDNMEQQLERPISGFEMPDVNCSVTMQGWVVVLEASFVTNRTLHENKYLTCLTSCFSQNDRLPITISQTEKSVGSISVMVVVIAAVCSILGGLALMLVVGLLGVRYQRKQAWVIRENKQSSPGPLPCLQNSGLIYEVDGRGLVVPVTPVKKDPLEAIPSPLSPIEEDTNVDKTQVHKGGNDDKGGDEAGLQPITKDSNVDESDKLDTSTAESSDS